jgi:hypothetical protein
METMNILRIYTIIILTVVLYEHDILSLILREEHSLRLFENRVLRIILVPKRDVETGGWRKLHIEGAQMKFLRQLQQATKPDHLAAQIWGEKCRSKI